MDKKYLNKAFTHNEMQIKKVVNEKVAGLRAEIEMTANHAFLIFDELAVAEQHLLLAQEETSDTNKRFNFANWFLILLVPAIYFIDLLLSQDAITYLLPESVEGNARVFFAYLVPGLFVIADLSLGLVRQKIKAEHEEDIDSNGFNLKMINAFGFAFCLILPMLVGATILAFTESEDIAASEITARSSLMVLSFVLHFFVIFLFPKKAFDYVFDYVSYKSHNKKVVQLERNLYKKINEMSVSCIDYKGKADKYDFVQPLHDIEFSFRSRLLINQASRSEAWNKILDENERLQQIINEDSFLHRFFPYKKLPMKVIQEPKPEPIGEPKPIKKPLRERNQIIVSYVQNDSRYEYMN